VTVVATAGLRAVNVFAPASAPSIQPPTVATPAAFVTAESPVTVPPPDVTVKLTRTPTRAVPALSARTAGATVTAAQTFACC